MDPAYLERKMGGVEPPPVEDAAERSTWLSRSVDALCFCRISDCIMIIFGSLLELLCSCCRGEAQPGAEDEEGRSLRNRVEIPSQRDEWARITDLEMRKILEQVRRDLHRVAQQDGMKHKAIARKFY